uniref:P8 n=1 Tax=Olivavirus actinidiae TaxID=2024724 RepID=A0A7L9CDJ4_9CLOS|nr:P8 [Actinidia virus 1]
MTKLLLFFILLVSLAIIIILSGAIYGVLYYKSDKKLKLSDSLNYVKEGVLIVSPFHDNGIGTGGNRTSIVT